MNKTAILENNVLIAQYQGKQVPSLDSTGKPRYALNSRVSILDGWWSIQVNGEAFWVWVSERYRLRGDSRTAAALQFIRGMAWSWINQQFSSEELWWLSASGFSGYKTTSVLKNTWDTRTRFSSLLQLLVLGFQFLWISIQLVGCLLESCHLLLNHVDLIQIWLQSGIFLV